MTAISPETENAIPRIKIRRAKDLGTFQDLEDYTTVEAQAYFESLGNLFGPDAILKWRGTWDGPHSWVLEYLTEETNAEYSDRLRSLEHKNEKREEAITRTRKREYEQFLRLKEKFEGPNAYASKPEET